MKIEFKTTTSRIVGKVLSLSLSLSLSLCFILRQTSFDTTHIEQLPLQRLLLLTRLCCERGVIEKLIEYDRERKIAKSDACVNRTGKKKNGGSERVCVRERVRPLGRSS
jgi:hypothetical protein